MYVYTLIYFKSPSSPTVIHPLTILCRSEKGEDEESKETSKRTKTPLPIEF